MKKNFVRFRDQVIFEPVDLSKLQDFYTSGQASNTPLRIQVAATHSGKITRNNGFYLPHKMRAAVNTWTDNYPKPIQVHHNDRADPIGRVVEAAYIDLSGNLHDFYQNRGIKDRVENSLFDNFVKGKLSFQDTVDIANKYFIQDKSITSDVNYEGLGYIRLTADISDPEAISKILDKRYLTGSVGASTDAAICSVCKNDWASDDGHCEHVPGEEYDGVKCVLIAGDLAYDEWSFVNRPADTHSTVIEVNTGGIADFVKIPVGNIPEITLQEVSPIKEEALMTFKDAIALARTKEHLTNLENLEDLVKSVLDQNPQTEEEFLTLLSPTTEDPKVKDVHVEDTTTVVEDEVVIEDTKTPVELFFGEEYAELVEDDTWGKDYAEMLFTLYEEAVTDEEKETAKSLIADAKLTSKKRKSLASSTFCGPDRSFPVPDCAHVTAARRLVNRYKGPGDKGRILACVNRKAKALGCGEADAVIDNDKEYFTTFSDEELVTLFDNITEVMKEREMNLGDPKDLEDKIKELQEELKQTDPLVQKQLDSARREIRYLCEDIDNLQNQLITQTEQVRKTNLDRLFDLTQLVNSESVDFVQLQDLYKDKSCEEIINDIQVVSEKLDFNQIRNTLNSGLTNNPQGIQVEDPTSIIDNTKTNGIIVDKTMLETIRDEFLRIRMSRGQVAAQQYIENLKRRGIIPSTIPQGEF